MLCKLRTFPWYQLDCPVGLVDLQNGFDLLLLEEMLMFTAAPAKMRYFSKLARFLDSKLN